MSDRKAVPMHDGDLGYTDTLIYNLWKNHTTLNNIGSKHYLRQCFQGHNLHAFSCIFSFLPKNYFFTFLT